VQGGPRHVTRGAGESETLSQRSSQPHISERGGRNPQKRLSIPVRGPSILDDPLKASSSSSQVKVFDQWSEKRV